METAAARIRWSGQCPCPVCGGRQNADRDGDERCHGYKYDDNDRVVYCSQSAHAGDLQRGNDNLYRHYLGGSCDCGVTHIGAPQGSTRRGVLEATYDYTDSTGHVLYRVVRTKDPKSFYQQRPDGKGGWLDGIAGYVPLVPLHLHLLVPADPSRPIFVVEGEKHAQALVQRGVLATTNPMGAMNWPDHFTAYFRHRHLRLLPDNDDQGRRHMQDVAAKLAPGAASLKVVELPDLPDKGDILDWLEAGGTIDALDQLAAGTPIWKPERAYPDPIPPTGRARPPFPIEVLPLPLRSYTIGVSRAYQVPLDLAATATLGCASAAVAGKIDFQVRPDWWEPLNLWFLVPYMSGGRKTQVVRECRKVIKDQIAKIRVAEKSVIAQAEALARIKSEELKAAERDVPKAAEKEKQEKIERAQRLAAEMTKDKPPKPERLLAKDATPERLAGLLAEGKSRLAIIVSEGGIFDIMAGRYSQGMPNLDIYLDSYSAEDHDSDRQSGKDVSVAHPCLTMFISPQPVTVQKLAKISDVEDRGVLARFLYACPHRPGTGPGYRDTNPDPLTAAEKEGYLGPMKLLLDLPVRLDEYERPLLHLLAMEPAAQAYFDAWFARHERSMRPEGDLHDHITWASKLAGNLLRIIGVLHLVATVKPLEQTCTFPADISLAIVQPVLDKLGPYYISHTKAAYSEMGDDIEIKRFRAVLEWLEKERCTSISKNDLWHALHGRHLLFNRARDLDGALDIMLENFYIFPADGQEEIPHKRGRKASTRYIVNPKILAFPGEWHGHIWTKDEVQAPPDEAAAARDADMMEF